MKNETEKNVSRRDFLRHGSAVVAGAAAGLATLGSPAIVSAQNVNSKITFGMLGSGSRGCSILDAIARHSQSIVTDVCDIYPPHLEAAKKAAANDKVRTTENWQEVLERKDVDALIIGAPLYLHVPMSIAGLEAGKHVFSEKSMGLNMKQINAMKAAADKHPKQAYLVGYQSRLNEGLQMIKDLIAEGSFGKITQFYCHFDRNQTWKKDGLEPKWERVLNWRLYKEYCGGLLTEVVTHELDQVLSVLGTKPKTAACHGEIMVYNDQREHHDSIMGTWKMEDGVIGVGTAHLSNGSQGSGFTLLGTHGTVESYGGKLKLYWEKSARHLDTAGVKHKFTKVKMGQSLDEDESPNSSPAKVIEFAVDSNYQDATAREFEHFYDIVLNGAKPIMDAASCHESSVMALMAYESSMNGGKSYSREDVLAMG